MGARRCALEFTAAMECIAESLKRNDVICSILSIYILLIVYWTDQWVPFEA